MKVVLLYMSGALQGREKSCDTLPVRLGADPSGEIFFDAFAHRMVSKLHAVILWENGAVKKVDPRTIQLPPMQKKRRAAEG